MLLFIFLTITFGSFTESVVIDKVDETPLHRTEINKLLSKEELSEDEFNRLKKYLNESANDYKEKRLKGQGAPS